MSFQWVFDNAASIAGMNRAITGQTITRNQTVRAVSRGNAIQKFTVQMPDGMPWDEAASFISALDAVGEYTVENVALSNANYTAWMHNGDFTALQNWDVICVSMPDWIIFDRNQVSWSGPFVFYESVV